MHNRGSGTGTAGHVRVHRHDGIGWTQMGSDIDGKSPTEGADGVSVRLSPGGTKLIIGAEETGVVRVYQWDGQDWAQLGCDVTGEQGFGRAVAMDDRGFCFVTGEPNAASAGSAAVYCNAVSVAPSARPSDASTPAPTPAPTVVPTLSSTAPTATPTTSVDSADDDADESGVDSGAPPTRPPTRPPTHWRTRPTRPATDATTVLPVSCSWGGCSASPQLRCIQMSCDAVDELVGRFGAAAVLDSVPECPATTTPASTTTTANNCPRNCGTASEGGGTCRATGNCLSCNADRLRVNGRCSTSLACKGRRIQTGSMTGSSCRCLDDNCHYCNRVADGDTCKRGSGDVYVYVCVQFNCNLTAVLCAGSVSSARSVPLSGSIVHCCPPVFSFAPFPPLTCPRRS